MTNLQFTVIDQNTDEEWKENRNIIHAIQQKKVHKNKTQEIVEVEDSK